RACVKAQLPQPGVVERLGYFFRCRSLLVRYDRGMLFDRCFHSQVSRFMRPACNARIPARTTGAGFIIKSFNVVVIFCCAALANPVSDMPGHSAVTVMPSRLSSR